MARFVLNTHKGIANVKQETMSHEFLRKYILYARLNIQPVFSNVNIDKVTHLYSDLRKESMSSGLPITVRHIESIIRISEAFAKMELRNTVTIEDIDEAISTVLDSFMGAQKYSITKNMKKKFIKYFKKNNTDIILFLLKEMYNERARAFHSTYIYMDELSRRVQNYGYNLPDNFFSSNELKESGFEFDSNRKVIKRVI
ncbi:DNA replication licensing factor mcm2 [Nosema bombycis CQ1]|uniref:DNA replication licensing factor mcm2 n=1 Tax=Nosema bombycis (strain CQ1 / CVCC 102059) TaxID=578461 RepID=R0MG85_NOSB1|nr:DNA replication licensing factor mcm2 [Nosema bombycis CQ1]|eukprot:EOB13150.1 DNA replication licensing factor mcm2 [Nosema bombycis CQ1]